MPDIEWWTEEQKNKVEAIHNLFGSLSWDMLSEMGLGDRIRTLRKMADLDQGSFAELVGVNRVTISEWERGRSVPRKSNAEVIAKVFGVGVDLFT